MKTPAGAALAPSSVASQSQAGRGAVLLLGCGLLILPFMVGDFVVFQLTLTIIYAIAILGLNLLVGYSGQISLGHGAFFAVGAYAAALMLEKLGLPYPLAIPLAGVLCFVVGFLFGFPALRLEGHYLALATFSLAVAVPQLLKHHSVEHLTGGVQGMLVTRPSAPFALPFASEYDLFGHTVYGELSDDRWLYFVALATAAILFWLVRNLTRRRVGRGLIALRDHAVAARSMGIDVARYKATVFGISAACTGIAGGLSAITVQFIAADSFTFFLSITLLVGAVVGGVQSLAGAVLGAIFVQFVPTLADSLSDSAPWAVYGGFMILIIYLMPNGISGLIADLVRRSRP